MNEFLFVRIGNENFGIDLARVEEALEAPTLHHVPEMPPTMLGVLLHRGAMISVYSPHRALSTVKGGTAIALILCAPEGRAGIVVDEVEEAGPLAAGEIEFRPDGHAVVGVAHRAARLISIVDVDALISACRSTTLVQAT